MVIETIDLTPVPITVEVTPSAQSLLGVVDLREMGRRSNRRGAAQFGLHLACIGATGLLVGSPCRCGTCCFRRCGCTG